MFAAFGGASRHLEQPEFPEQTTHIGRTKTGTIAVGDAMMRRSRARADNPRRSTSRKSVFSSGVIAVSMKCTIGMGVVASCTLVEACADGWWYSALLPGRRLIAVPENANIDAGLGSIWRISVSLQRASMGRKVAFKSRESGECRVSHWR